MFPLLYCRLNKPLSQMPHWERDNSTLGEYSRRGIMVARRGTMVRQERDNGILGEGQWYTTRGTVVH